MGYPGVSNRLGPADGFVPVDRTTIEVVPDARGCWHRLRICYPIEDSLRKHDVSADDRC